ETKRAANSIALARPMKNYPSGRYAVRWAPNLFSTPLPHLQEVRWLAKLMMYDARLRAHDNDLDGALEDVKSALYASRAIGDEPVFISQLVRIACDAIAVKTLETSLANGQASAHELFDLQKELEAEAQTPFFLIG